MGTLIWKCICTHKCTHVHVVPKVWCVCYNIEKLYNTPFPKILTLLKRPKSSCTSKGKACGKKKIQTKSVISIISISTRMSKPTLSPHFLKSLGNNQARQNIFGGTYLSLRIRVLSRLFGTFLHHFFRRFGRAGGNQELARIGSWQGKSHTKHTHHHNCTHEIILGERQRPTVINACLLIIGSVFPKVPTTLHNE